MSEALKVEIVNNVATLSNNDAPYNRMTLEYMDELEALLPELASDASVRALVFTAEGLEHFSVGMNLKQFPQGIEQKGSADAVLDQRLRVLNMIEHLGKPSIATLFGYCLGGGLELPLACHFRLAASESAQIHALDMILRARKIDGAEALRIGLVMELYPVEELKGRAQQLGEELAAQPRLAVKGVLDTVIGFESKSLARSILDERAAVHLTRGTADAQEGMQAFLEKRPPVFNREGEIDPG